MKQCTTCWTWKDEEEFSFRQKALGIRWEICKECKSKQQSEWYESHKKEHLKNVRRNTNNARDAARPYVWEYLSTHPCSECGESDPQVLEFDHISGKTKDISAMVGQGYSLDTIQTEIDKCRVLCANCHRRHTGQSGVIFPRLSGQSVKTSYTHLNRGTPS